MRINVWRDWTGKPCFRDKVTGACEATLRFSNSNVFSSCVFTASQRSCGKVMFSVVCVCHSDCLSKGDPRVTITRDALSLTVQDPPGPGPLLDIRSGTPGPRLPSTDIWWPTLWRPVQTCSLEDPQEATPGGGHWSTYHFPAGYASYWNAFLLFMYFSAVKRRMRQLKTYSLWPIRSALNWLNQSRSLLHLINGLDILNWLQNIRITVW